MIKCYNCNAQCKQKEHHTKIRIAWQHYEIRNKCKLFLWVVNDTNVSCIKFKS